MPRQEIQLSHRLVLATACAFSWCCGLLAIVAHQPSLINAGLQLLAVCENAKSSFEYCRSVTGAPIRLQVGLFRSNLFFCSEMGDFGKT